MTTGAQQQRYGIQSDKGGGQRVKGRQRDRAGHCASYLCDLSVSLKGMCNERVQRVLYGGGPRPSIKACSCHRNSISMATEGKRG